MATSKLAEKRGDYTTFAEYIKDRTGKTIKELNVFSEQKIERLSDVADEIRRAKDKNIPVYVLGDYDADGICSVINLSILFNYLDMEYHLIIPERADGYGLSLKYVEKIPENVLLITIDNGITAVEPIKEAKKRGMKVIVLDHHLSSDVIPEADIIVDPEAFPETADFDGYCGAGLAYKLCELMIEDKQTLDEVSAYAATATVADVVPLLEDNRRIVQKGLEVINSHKVPYGLNLLYRILCGTRPVTSEQISFYGAPAINAPGRLIPKGGQLSAKAISNRNQKEAEQLVARLIKQNNERKELVTAAMEEITAGIDDEYISGHKVMFIKCNAPAGILGLIAAKVAEKYKKPAFVMAKKDGLYAGSFRSDDEKVNHGRQMLDFAKDCFVSYGGHAGAAGFSLKTEDFEKAAEKLEQYDVKPHEDDKYDLLLDAKDIQAVREEMDQAEPFGKSIETPVFRVLWQYDKENRTYMSDQKHVKFVLPGGIEAPMFNHGQQYIEDGEPQLLYLYGHPSWNYFKGEQKVQFSVKKYEIISQP